MAEKKKRKSIYDKPLKDINKDGKTNFADTWLGDALGFDGKLGIQEDRPGLKESLKGARRGADKKDKDKPKRPKSRPSRSSDSDKSASPSSRLDTKGETPKGPRSSTGGPARYSNRKSPAAGSPSPDQYNTMMGKMTSDQLKKFRDLPAAEKIKVYNRYSDSGNITLPTSGSSSRKSTRPGRSAGEKGMAKGGMTSKMGRHQQSGKRDMKKTGMFYDSKSPRGYK